MFIELEVRNNTSMRNEYIMININQIAFVESGIGDQAIIHMHGREVPFTSTTPYEYLLELIKERGHFLRD